MPRVLTKEQRERYRQMNKGERSYLWKGQGASYNVIHRWLSHWYGRPSKCEICGTTKSKKFEWANISGKYIRDRADFKRVCISCHRVMDRKPTCKKGHALSGTNLIIYKNHPTFRICRICKNSNLRRWRASKDG